MDSWCGTIAKLWFFVASHLVVFMNDVMESQLVKAYNSRLRCPLYVVNRPRSPVYLLHISTSLLTFRYRPRSS